MDETRKKLIARSIALLEKVTAIDKERLAGQLSYFSVSDLTARAGNLIQSVTGPRSAYAEHLRHALKEKTSAAQFLSVAGILQGFHLDLTEGNLVNIRHEVETVVVSELLTQSKKLIQAKGVHPAAAVIVACAAMEEFLRNWCSERALSIQERQRSTSVYAAELRKSGAIDLPTERRVQSWADYRNAAAHGDRWGTITPEIGRRVVQEIEDFLLENRHVLGS